MNEKCMDAISKLSIGVVAILAMVYVCIYVTDKSIDTFEPIARDISRSMERMSVAVEILTRTYTGE